MRVRFQADADLDERVLHGLRRAMPEIDFRTATAAGLEGLPDPEVLRVAADTGRVLVSQDRRTMPSHFRRFVSATTNPGVILCGKGVPTLRPTEKCLLIWPAVMQRIGLIG